MFKDFKTFLLRGNIVELAVAVVIGSAFGAVITAFVQDLLTPLLGIPGRADFGALKFTIRDSTFSYGHFLNSLISFLMVAAAIFFVVVRPVNKLMERRRTETDVDSLTKDCTHCLSSIPEAATVCAFCTRDVVDAA